MSTGRLHPDGNTSVDIFVFIFCFRITPYAAKFVFSFLNGVCEILLVKLSLSVRVPKYVATLFGPSCDEHFKVLKTEQLVTQLCYS